MKTTLKKGDILLAVKTKGYDNSPDECDELCFVIIDEQGDEHLYGYNQLISNDKEYLFDIGK